MAAYDTVPPEDFRIPEWIKETVHTRNTVNIRPHCEEYVRKIQNKLVQYKNDPEAYLLGKFWCLLFILCMILVVLYLFCVLCVLCWL